MKHKVGDIVTIKSKEWYDKNKDQDGCLDFGVDCFMPHMSKYCGREAHITGLQDYTYSIDIDNERWNWTDEMLES